MEGCFSLARLRHASNFDALNQSIGFIRACQWPPQLQILALFENLQNTQRLIELPMTVVNVRLMRNLVLYFNGVPRLVNLINVPQGDSFEKLATCLLYFADEFGRTNSPFVPIIISTAISYAYRGHLRIHLKCNVMPSLHEFLDFFSGVNLNGGQIIGSNKYFPLSFLAVPPPMPLRRLFLHQGLVVVNFANVPINVLLVPHFQNFPLIRGVILRDLIDVFRIMMAAKNHRAIDCGIAVANNRLLIHNLIKILSYFEVYRMYRRP